MKNANYTLYKNYLLGAFFVLISFISNARHLELLIKIKEESGEYIMGSTATIYFNNQKINSVIANDKGYIETILDFDKVYTIEIEEKNHDKAKLNVDTKIPSEMKKFIYNYTTTINLIEKKEGFKVVYTQDPTIYIVYKKDKDQFGMISKYLASFNYQPDKPALVKNENVPKGTPPPKEAPTTSPTPLVEVPVKDNRDKDKALNDRLLNSKGKIGDLEKQKENEKVKEINDQEILASKKRSFMQEIADSKKTIKIVEFEKSEKRLP